MAPAPDGRTRTASRLALARRAAAERPTFDLQLRDDVGVLRGRELLHESTVPLVHLSSAGDGDRTDVADQRAVGGRYPAPAALPAPAAARPRSHWRFPRPAWCGAGWARAAHGPRLGTDRQSRPVGRAARRPR